MIYEEALQKIKHRMFETIETDEDWIAIECIEKQIRNQADGCAGCAFESYEEWEMPCRKCKRNCKDYWRAKA